MQRYILWLIIYYLILLNLTLADPHTELALARLSSPANITTIANNIILSIGSGGFFDYHKLRGLTNPNNQDMLIVVPTPAIAGLAGLGLVGMRRRRR